MLLQKLVEYATDRIEQTPPLYTERPIRYVVELDADGNPLGVTDTADLSERRTRNGARRLAPQVQRTVAIKPLLLADRVDYTFGRMRAADSSERQVQERNAAYADALERCADATGEPAVGTVLHFLRNDPLSSLALPEDFDDSAALTFRVDGSFVIDLPAVQRFWAREHSVGGSGSGGAQCLVCGREGPVLKRLPSKIKGVPGGQSSGTALISANEEAFESYGLEASRTAPVCESCGELFTKALNDLLASEGNSYRIGGAAFIFWTREETGFSFRSFMDRPDAEEVRALIASVQAGRSAARLDETAFYAAALSGSGGRAVVRDWIDTTVADVKRSLARWFRMQRVVNWDNSEPGPLSLYQLAGATVRELRDLSPATPRALLRAALTGTPLPGALLYQAVRRNQAEQRLTHSRAALIKLVLMSRGGNDDNQEDDMVSLNEEHPSAAYHCGRLLAELEAAQRGAIPGAKATITDRFYGTASTAPASVFPRLVRGAQPHLSKLERDRPGAYRALDRRIEEICARIPAFPKTLTLDEQGVFSLGYYHQRAHDRAAMTEARARRAGAEQTGEDPAEE